MVDVEGGVRPRRPPARGPLFRPALRKTGTYSVPSAPVFDNAILTKLVDQMASMQATLAVLVERDTKERRAALITAAVTGQIPLNRMKP